MLSPLLLIPLISISSVLVDASDFVIFREDTPPEVLGLTDVKARLDAEAHRALAMRRERFESIKSLDDAHAWQSRLKADFLKHLGGFPERTPLNAHTVFAGMGDGFRFEKVIFESRPGFFVTAVLYLPLGEGPYPAVLIPCGHEDTGKATESYQRAAILLARHGIAAFCYDPIGQGERFAFHGPDGEPFLGTTIEHTLVGVGAILTGTNTAAYRIYDGMRGLDYLESRSDIDPAQLGCTGNSGGGTLTSYIMALDSRVKAAAPVSYITSWDALLETMGPQDAEQNIFGQHAWGMDHADFLHMRAPQPTLICAASRDAFPISGTWDTYREAKRFCTVVGYPERVGLVEADEEHGFTMPLRSAMVHWMQRWLLALDQPVSEPAFAVLSAEETQCTASGRVKDLPGSRSPFDLNRERMEHFAPQRLGFWRDPSSALSKIGAIIGIDVDEVRTAPAVTHLGAETRSGVTIRRLALHSGSGLAVPAILIEPASVRGWMIYIHQDGKRALMEKPLQIDDWLEQDMGVLAMDYTAAGELEPTAKYSGQWELAGKHWDSYYRAYDLGKSFVGMRTQDILAALSYLSETYLDSPIQLHAEGAATVPALHAAIFRKDVLAGVTLVDGIPSWSAVVNEDRAWGQIENAVHGALEHYDLPSLADYIGTDKVTILNPHVPVH